MKPIEKVTFYSLLICALLLGFLIGSINNMSDSITLKPYTGPASGVLKHGTVLKEQYKNPDSVAGTLNINGIWIMETKE